MVIPVAPSSSSEAQSSAVHGTVNGVAQDTLKNTAGVGLRRGYADIVVN